MKCSELRAILAQVEDMCGDVDVQRLHAHPILSVPTYASITDVEVKKDAVSYSVGDWAEHMPSNKPPYVVLT